MSVAIIDYGSGNLRSAAKALEAAAREETLDLAIEVTAKAETVRRATHIVLPGVGAFFLDATPHLAVYFDGYWLRAMRAFGLNHNREGGAALDNSSP